MLERRVSPANIDRLVPYPYGKIIARRSAVLARRWQQEKTTEGDCPTEGRVTPTPNRCRRPPGLMTSKHEIRIVGYVFLGKLETGAVLAPCAFHF